MSNPARYRKFMIIFYDYVNDKLRQHFEIAPDMFTALESFRMSQIEPYICDCDVLSCYTTEY